MTKHLIVDQGSEFKCEHFENVWCEANILLFRVHLGLIIGAELSGTAGARGVFSAIADSRLGTREKRGARTTNRSS